MVIEPPAETGVLGIAKVDADIFITVEAVGGKGMRFPLVLERAEQDFHVPAGHLLPIEPSEDSGRTAAVKTIAVIKDAQPHPFKLEGCGRLGKRDPPNRGAPQP